MKDDNEEVFRRAAEGYPLNTGTGDWEAMLRKLSEHGTASETALEAKKQNYRWLLLLLLLIPAALIKHYYRQPVPADKKNERRQFPAQAVAQSKPKSSGEPASGNDLPDAGLKPDKNNKATTNVAISPEENMSKASVVTAEAGDLLTGSHKNIKDDKINRNTKSGNKNGYKSSTTFGITSKALHQHDRYGKSSSRASAKKSFPEETNEEFSAGIKKKRIISKQKTTVNITPPEMSLDENEEVVQGKQEIDVEILAAGKTNNNMADSTNMTVNELARNKKLQLDSTKIPHTARTKTALATKKKKLAGQKLYVGLIAGPDISSIKLQAVKKAGFSFGIIAGYRLSKSFSVETGLLKDKKNYSSAGKYFSTKNIPVYPNTTIDYVSGDCNMFEVPLNVNYAFHQKNKAAWFISAGLSSYFMQKEAYIFDVNYMGNNYPYAADYKNHDNQFMAVINISVGYTHRLGKIADLRVQPYLKIPVNKVGTGELPIQSACLLIGLTKNLF